MKHLEIIELDLTRPGDYDLARVALDGRLAIPFEIPKNVRREQFRHDEDFEAFLARQAQTLLDTYGDAREQRQDASEFVA